MTKLPKETDQQLRRLIAEGLPAEQIAFMLRLSRDFVEAEMARLNTTRRQPSKES